MNETKHSFDGTKVLLRASEKNNNYLCLSKSKFAFKKHKVSENKLFSIFNSLSGVEKRECANFLRSPYFNQRSDVVALWHILLDSKGNPPDARVAFQQLYAGEAFDDARWRHVQSFLLLQIENFLAQRALEQVPLLYDLHMAPAYREKGLAKPLNNVLQRAAGKLSQLPRDQEFYYWEYRLEWEKYAATESDTRSRDNNLAAVSRSLDVFLLASKLRMACLMESHRAVYNTAYDLSFLPALVAYLEHNALREIPIIALYYHCYRALTGGQEADFRAFRRQLERQGDQLPAGERRTFLLLAVNYCIRRLNTGASAYIREAFDLYRIGLDSAALLENGRLGRFAYKNIVALGLRLEEFAWVEDFIHRYEPYLEPKYRAANRDYNLARLYFAQKDYHSAMPLLAQVDESDLLLNLDSRVMLLKMYYESGEWDALEALLSSFKVLLLRKKKVIGYHQSHYLNTLRYIRKLTRLNQNDKQAVAAFRAEVSQSKTINEKEWLMEQLI